METLVIFTIIIAMTTTTIVEIHKQTDRNTDVEKAIVLMSTLCIVKRTGWWTRGPPNIILENEVNSPPIWFICLE